MAKKTKEQAQATKQALIDAAEVVFLKKGVSNTTLAEIAQEAGLTRGAIYWHFKNKADIYIAMMDRVILPLEIGTSKSIEIFDTSTPAKTLYDHMTNVLKQIYTDEQIQRVLEIAIFMTEETNELIEIRENHKQITIKKQETIAQLLEKAIKLQNIKINFEAVHLAISLHSIIYGLVSTWILTKNFNLPKVGNKTLKIFFNGIGLQIK